MTEGMIVKKFTVKGQPVTTECRKDFPIEDAKESLSGSAEFSSINKAKRSIEANNLLVKLIEEGSITLAYALLNRKKVLDDRKAVGDLSTVRHIETEFIDDV